MLFFVHNNVIHHLPLSRVWLVIFATSLCFTFILISYDLEISKLTHCHLLRNCLPEMPYILVHHVSSTVSHIVLTVICSCIPFLSPLDLVPFVIFSNTLVISLRSDFHQGWNSCVDHILHCLIWSTKVGSCYGSIIWLESFLTLFSLNNTEICPLKHSSTHVLILNERFISSF